MKTVLVTGASGGIGSAIVNALEKTGCRVIPISHKDADLSSFSAVEKLRIAHQEAIGWLICTHGFVDDSLSIDEQTPENMQKTFEVNTLSLFYIAKVFMDQISAGGGMIFISSTAGINANGRLAAYSASKAAVNSLAQALARNKSDKKFFSVCPGPTNTAMRERIAHDAATKQSPDVVAALVQQLVGEQSEYLSGDIIRVQDEQVSIVSRLS